MDDPETRFCERCLHFRPVTEFRPRYRDGSARMKTCNVCHAAAERERRASQRVSQDRRRMRQHFAAITEERYRQKVDLLAQVMLAEFGGLGGFLLAFQDYLADAKRRGGLANWRAIHATLRLMESAARHSSERVATMSEEELLASLRPHVRDLIAAHPEVAVCAAAELGWAVIPPDETAQRSA
jgi:hypothetical protein